MYKQLQTILYYDLPLQTSRDPRFDDLSGTFNEDLFKKSYSFLDDMKTNEKRVSGLKTTGLNFLFNRVPTVFKNPGKSLNLEGKCFSP